MLTKLFLGFFLVYITSVNCDYIYRKICKDVDPSVCDVHQVNIDKCENAKFCRMKKNKRYSLHIDFTPHFTAESVQIGSDSDHDNNDFEYHIENRNACDLMSCPLTSETRQTLSYPFKAPKALPRGKFPIKVKIWDASNVTSTCCFTFNIKVK